MFSYLALSLTLAAPSDQAVAAAPNIAAKIDEIAGKHWQLIEVKPAGLVNDHGFLRRVTIDLAGRIPTYAEARAFAEDRSPDKRIRAVEQLMASPEYAVHMSYVLDEMIQLKYAGDREFIEYLRVSLAQKKPWDQMFRDMMLGPWDTKENKRANRFLLRRLRKLDEMTNDTSRVFFGVNVSCAKCHDHPLVKDWKQDHYFGMASFFNRTTKGKAKDSLGEKTKGDVSFTNRKGEKRTAKLMFLSNQIVDEPKKPPKNYTRREQLVKLALEDSKFFRRAIVNRLWHYLMGRGLVQPVDQMHSENPATIPDVLDWLGDDFANNGYRLDRVIAGIVCSKTYQLSSRRAGMSAEARPQDFALAQLRPLTPRQYAMSMVLATGDQKPFDADKAPDKRSQRYKELEGRANGLLSHDQLDERSDRYQASANEALFMSNNEQAQRLTVASGTNLTARLAGISDNDEMVEHAVWTIFSRPAEAEEKSYLVRWVEGRKEDRKIVCSNLVWALMTSAEFRFNH